MDFILLAAIALFAYVSIWLWRLAKTQVTPVFVETSFRTSEVAAFYIRRAKLVSVLAVLDRGIVQPLLRLLELIWNFLISVLWFGSAIGLFTGGVVIYLIVMETDRFTDRTRSLLLWIARVGLSLLWGLGIVFYRMWGSSLTPCMCIKVFLIWLPLVVLSLIYFPFGGGGGGRWQANRPDFPLSGAAIERPEPTSHLEDVEFYGEATLPRRVYEGDSQSISVHLRPSLLIQLAGSESLTVKDTKSGKSLTVKVRDLGDHEQFLEIEMQGAGIVIDGEKKQRQPLNIPRLAFHWNCYFPNSGNHTLDLLLRLVHPTANIELGAVQHRVKVVKLDHMTKRQVWVLATLAGMISGSLAIAQVLHTLGLW